MALLQTSSWSKRKKYAVIGGSITLGLLLLLLLVAQSLTPWVKKKLQEEVHLTSKGVYTLHLANLRLSLLAGSATLDSLVLLPNKDAWQQLEKKDPASAPFSISVVRARQVKLNGFSYWQILFGDALKISSIQVVAPDWQLTQMKKDTTNQPLHQSLGNQFKRVIVQEINVEEGAFRLKDSPEKKTNTIALEGIQLKVKGVQIDSAAYVAKDRAYYSKEILFTQKSATIFLPDGNYKIQAGALQASTEDRSLSLQNVRLVPLLSASAMSKKAGEAVTRFDIQVPGVEAHKFDFHTYSQNSNIQIAALTFQKPQIKAFKDSKNFGAKTEGLLPHDFMEKIPFGVNIRKLQVNNLFVRYDELAPKAVEVGYVTGSNINLTLSNFTNDKNLISRKNPAVLTADGMLMGKTHLKATARLPLLDKSGFHTLKGTIGEGDPAILNPMLEPSMRVKVKSGYVQKGSFEVILTRASAEGSMDLVYDEFQIGMQNKDPDEKPSLGNKVKTFIANKLVLKSESKEDGTLARTGKIAVTRRPKRSFLTYWKDCLANGTLSIIGAPM